MTDETLLGIDAQSAWDAFTSREATKRSRLSPPQSMAMVRVASFVRDQIGGRFPSGRMFHGTVSVCWASPTHFLFIEVLSDGQIRWELSDERIFRGDFTQGDEWNSAFEVAVEKFASSVTGTRS